MSAPDTPDDPEKKYKLKDNAKVENILKAASRLDHAPPGSTGIKPPLVAQSRPLDRPMPVVPKASMPGLAPGGGQSQSQASEHKPAKQQKPTFKRLGDKPGDGLSQSGDQTPPEDKKKTFKPLHAKGSLSDRFNEETKPKI